MRIFNFMSKCQDVDIETQYEDYNVRCFDLRVRFEGSTIFIAHGMTEYDMAEEVLFNILAYLNKKGDCAVRVLLECRTKKPDNAQLESFTNFCYFVERYFDAIKFWCGRSLYDWTIVYDFKYKPSCEEKYSSVCKPKWVDDWWPRLYAKRKNKEILKEGTDKDYLLIDFVNYS